MTPLQIDYQFDKLQSRTKMLARLQRTLKLIHDLPVHSDLPEAPPDDVLAEQRDDLHQRTDALIKSLCLANIDGNDASTSRINDTYTRLIKDVTEHCASNAWEGQLQAFNEATCVPKASGSRSAAIARGARNVPDAPAPETCICGGALVFDDALYARVCDACGMTVEKLDMQVNARVQRASDSISIDKEMQTLNKMIQMIQGELVGDDIVKSVETDWPVIERQFRLDYPQRHTMRVENARVILTALQLRKYCKIAPYLFARYTSRPALVMTKDEIDYVRKAYREVIIIWKTYQTTHKTRITNLPNCAMIIFEIIEASGWPGSRNYDLQDNIYHLERGTVDKFRGDFWRCICEQSKLPGANMLFRYKY